MEKLTASIVLEVLGRPAENVTDALQTLVERMSKEKGILIKDKKIHEPVKVEDAQDLFTSFAEVELEFDSLAHYFGIIFSYMPSNVELIDPQKVTLQNTEITDLANALTQRIHTYDAIARNYLMERELLFQKLKEISPDTYKKVVEYITEEAKGKKDGKESKS